MSVCRAERWAGGEEGRRSVDKVTISSSDEDLIQSSVGTQPADQTD